MRLMGVALDANVEEYSLAWRCSSVSNIVQAPASDQIDEGFRQYLAFDTENDVGESHAYRVGRHGNPVGTRQLHAVRGNPVRPRRLGVRILRRSGFPVAVVMRHQKHDIRPLDSCNIRPVSDRPKP